ncbi:MAG: hypothetical protein IPK83_22160 [Planctomycetes bacterium]|nr:hypothetical protein [Planctomycetota bacterium]
MNNRNDLTKIGSKTLDMLRSMTLGSVRRTGFLVMMLARIAFATQVQAQTVTVSLVSPQNGAVLSPGETVEWTLSVDVSASDNDGLAFVCADLVQNEANPAYLDIPHAASVPQAMASFSAPAGVSNPPDEGMSSGYVGKQVGQPGGRNLLQIGGGQTLFGHALPAEVGLAQTAFTNAGVGQNGSVTVATGSFAAPSAGGAYQFEIRNVLANVLSEANQPPNFSLAQAAAVNSSGASFSFSVIGETCDPYDANCDGSVNGLDVQDFTAALIDPVTIRCSSCSCDTDVNGVVDTADVQLFVARLLE